MNKKQRMYVDVEAREDFIYIDGNESKFYPHPELENVYASRNGQIARKRIVSEKILIVPQRKMKNGYVDCNLASAGGNQLVHRLVLQTFNPEPTDGLDYVVDHINDKRYDNRLENLQWLSRTANLKKRDEAGSLNKDTYVYDRVTDTVTHYDSRLLAADAINYYVSNMVTAIKKEIIIRGRYFVTDDDYLLAEDYYYIFKEYDLKKELRAAKLKKQEVLINKSIMLASNGYKGMVK